MTWDLIGTSLEWLNRWSVSSNDPFYIVTQKHRTRFKNPALRDRERPQLQECEAAWWGLSHSVKVCPCLFFLKVSECVNEYVCVCVCVCVPAPASMCVCVCVCVCVCGLSDWEGLTERASQSASIFLSKWRLSLRRLRLISRWLTVRPDREVFPPGFSHTHTHTHTHTPLTPLRHDTITSAAASSRREGKMRKR